MIWIRTGILGLGFFAISAVGPLYDSYMPIFYGQFLRSSFLVGLVMILDNVLGLTLQPYFGALSDQTCTRFGRRIPYFLAGCPLAALCLAAVPFAYQRGLGALLAATVLLNLALSAFRSPTIALMPDLVPPHLRSQANGVINWMGALGAALAFGVGGLLYKRDLRLPFAAFALLLIAVTLVFLFWIREPGPSREQPEEGPGTLSQALAGLGRGLANPHALPVLAAIFLWSCAFQANATWFTTFGTAVRGMHPGDASFTLLFFSAAILVFAIPAGVIGGRWGRRQAIAAGALLMGAGIASLWFLTAAWPMRGALLAAGLGHSLVVVNAYPALVQMAGDRQTGAYTGLYYIASQLGAIAAPPVYGLVIDHVGWWANFALSAVLLAGAAAAVLQARHAEAAPSDGAA